LTKPTEGLHDRCSKCGEKYTFSNEWSYHELPHFS
jgi:hypothetical protein